MSRSGVGLFVRPKWADDVVNRRFEFLMDYLFWVGTNVVNYAKTRNFEFSDLREENAIRSNVEINLQREDPIFFFHASHGNYDMIAGQDESNLICCTDEEPNLKKNHDVLRQRIVYTLSCKSAKKLGPEVIKIGGISYLGYDSTLHICLVEGNDMDGAFEDIWAGGAKKFLDGKTAKEVYDWVMSRYEYWISYWQMRDHWARVTMLFTLRQDCSALRLLGENDSRITG